jgi:quinol monooxygenase YgiN
MSPTVPVTMSVIWRVPVKESQGIIGALQHLLPHTKAEPGCEGCHLTTELGEIAVIRYFEKWRSEADLQRQLLSDRFATLAELMEHATESPVVEFVLPGKIRQLDYVDEVRRGL